MAKGPATRGEAPLDTVSEVATPELVVFRYRSAGPARRALAYLIDATIRALIIGVFAALLMASTGEKGSLGAILLLVFAVEWGYYVLFDTLRAGVTPGRSSMSLRVVMQDGSPINFGASALRNLLRAADFLPAGYAVGLLVSAYDDRFRRLGDLVAGTMMISEDRGTISRGVEIEPPPKPSELAFLPDLTILAPGEFDAIEAFNRRLPYLHPDRADELAELLVPEILARTNYHNEDPVRFLQLLYSRSLEQRHQGAATSRVGLTSSPGGARA